MNNELSTDVRFADRAEAGRKLAAELREYAGREDVVVLALPRGGVPVAFEVARELRTPLDVFVVRKLGLPAEPELAMGAIASGGARVLNDEVVQAAGIPPETIEAVAAREREELARREQLYRGERPSLTVEGKTVILVDDGVATGSTMRVAVQALRRQRPAHTPEPFIAIGVWYEDFPQTSDGEIRDLLARVEDAYGRA